LTIFGNNLLSLRFTILTLLPLEDDFESRDKRALFLDGDIWLSDSAVAEVVGGSLSAVNLLSISRTPAHDDRRL
jgi:hypothetical protein